MNKSVAFLLSISIFSAISFSMKEEDHQGYRKTSLRQNVKYLLENKAISPSEGGNFLADADLSGAELSDVDFSGADLSSANLEDARLDGANLTGVNLTRTRLAGTKFKGAYYLESGVPKAVSKEWLTNKGAILAKVVVSLESSDRVPWDFSGRNIASGAFSKKVLFGISFRGSKGPNVDFSNSNLTNCDLSGANFSGSSFAMADLTGTILKGTVVATADFRGAYYVDESGKTHWVTAKWLESQGALWNKSQPPQFLDSGMYELMPPSNLFTGHDAEAAKHIAEILKMPSPKRGADGENAKSKGKKKK